MISKSRLVKPPKRRKKHKPRSGRPPLKDSVRVTAIQTPQRTQVQFTFAENVIEKLLQLHEDIYHPLYSLPYNRRWAEVRVEFARLADLGMPMVFVRIEPPSFDPRGYRLRRATKASRRLVVRLNPDKLGLKPGIPTKDAELMWFDQDRVFRGLGLIFDDADLVPLTDERERAMPVDLVVHARTRVIPLR